MLLIILLLTLCLWLILIWILVGLLWISSNRLSLLKSIIVSLWLILIGGLTILNITIFSLLILLNLSYNLIVKTLHYFGGIFLTPSFVIVTLSPFCFYFFSFSFFFSFGDSAIVTKTTSSLSLPLLLLLGDGERFRLRGNEDWIRSKTKRKMMTRHQWR